MAKLQNTDTAKLLFSDIAKLIEESKSHVAQTVNSALTLLYWKIGKRINDEVLSNKRAEYGKQIVVSVIRQLETDYGKVFQKRTFVE